MGKRARNCYCGKILPLSDWLNDTKNLACGRFLEIVVLKSDWDMLFGKKFDKLLGDWRPFTKSHVAMEI